MRLLLVEDERDLRRALARALTEAGFAVDESADGEDGLFRALEIDYDAIVLDLMLPRLGGFEVLEQVRRSGRTAPVLLLTARDAIDDRVRGLNGGADDDLSKPFALEELVARLRALIRRAAQHPAPAVAIGDLAVDLAARRVHRRGHEVELTGREYSILELLVRQRGTVVPRTVLFDHLYNEDHESTSNAIDVHIASLRRKLGASLIETRRGLGYLIDG
jgi:two-component system OmpR family response regulator